ncbi:MAG: nucleotidyl transferase AbiEii/AbiGii toxin family protein [Agathobacter sp.]|uniref:nucleotidyl transferase AbiEii/AbiGii toxin family protein n=1 Tax=Agathobacter sp. TaxID=2021311 RepID=UPI003996A04D
MYLHKENRELFRDVILLTSQKLEVSEDIVEKDYYVTSILKKLSEIDYPIVFKGGTSLSKAFNVIDRFSEDIDITFTEHLGEARRKKLKYNIIKPIADDLELNIRNFNSVESDKNLNHYDFYYESVVGDRVLNAIPHYVKLETSLMSYAFPPEKRNLENYIFKALGKTENELIAAYDLETFQMRVQSLNRTLIDKIFAVCDYYLQGKAHRNARHLYDIYKLSKYVRIDKDFLELVGEVRNHRIEMGTNIAPSAPLEVNIPELVEKICDDDFYKIDYKETTLKLISDNLSYDEVKNHYREIAIKIFEN